MNSRLKTVMNFKGYGNPEGKYWFIGIEEALSIDNDEKLKPYKSGILYNEIDDYTKEKEKFKKEKEHKGKRYTSVYDIIGKVLMHVDGNTGDLTKFLDNNLFFRNGNNFYTNIFPLGKPKVKTKLPIEELEFFGIGDKDKYINAVEDERYKMLRKLWNDSNQEVTICFGKGHWNKFVELFNLKESKSIEVEKGKIAFYPDEKIYLVPFFVNFLMSGTMIDKLSQDIKKRINN